MLSIEDTIEIPKSKGIKVVIESGTFCGKRVVAFKDINGLEVSEVEHLKSEMICMLFW
jgi:hypothetical protein